MPNRPNVVTLSKNSVDILNAIRNGASANYRDYVPEADQSLDSLRQIGDIIMNYDALQNEFLSALINRIGRVLISSRMYSNPWNMLKKGTLEFGETIEEVFVNIAKPFQYDPAVAENKIFAREIPDVRTAFHIMNYKKFYKATIQQYQLKQAFLAWQGIYDLIAKIVDAMYTGANYDEFLTMKYVIARQILGGRLYPVTIPEANKANAGDIVSVIKGISNDFEFMKTKYNQAGVSNYSDKKRQFLIVNSKFDAIMDVNVLASAFNMDKAEFMGRKILVDSFGDLDMPRLRELLGKDETFVDYTDDELKALDAIPAILIDEDWFMIYDNLFNFTENFNGEGMYWNYWYHVWKTFSVSPFANNALFVPAVPSVTSVTITPETVGTSAGSVVGLVATVETENFAPQTVVWTVEEVEGVSIDQMGVVSISPDVASGTTFTVTATSTFDSEISGTATVTIS